MVGNIIKYYIIFRTSGLQINTEMFKMNHPMLCT